MPDYDRRIVYLSEMEHDTKIKNTGFVRVESCGSKLLLDMHVNGIVKASDGQYPVFAEYSAERAFPVGRIFLRGGKGEWKETLDMENIGDDGAAEGVIQKLYVALSEERRITGSFAVYADIENKSVQKSGSPHTQKEAELKAESCGSVPEKGEIGGEPGGDAKRDGGRTLRIWKNEGKKKAAFAQKENTGELTGQQEKEKYGKQISDVTGSLPTTGKLPVTGKIPAAETNADHIILNDKWQQLMRLYPVVHPYEDDREYISIQPKDFVIMTGDFQHLANNSFLLHGFYNYRYLVLGKEWGTAQSQSADEDRTESFYLGVPGVYYEREKMVALMFGFEAFECVGGRAEPGTFGYYLRKVKI